MSSFTARGRPPTPDVSEWTRPSTSSSAPLGRARSVTDEDIVAGCRDVPPTICTEDTHGPRETPLLRTPSFVFVLLNRRFPFMCGCPWREGFGFPGSRVRGVTVSPGRLLIEFILL